MFRRTLEPITPKALVDEVLYSSLDWPGKTVRLERDTLASYCQRPVSAEPSIAEIYHENSKLFPANLEALAATRVDTNGVRREFLTRRSGALANIPDAQVSQLTSDVITRIAGAIALEFFYAVELRLVEANALIIHEPLTNRVICAKYLSDDEVGCLQRGLHLLTGTEGIPRLTIFLIGSFARNDFLFGVRGYRRTLLEAGQVLNSTLNVIKGFGISAVAHYEFHDRSLDRLLEADGVEEGVIAAIECE